MSDVSGHGQQPQQGQPAAGWSGSDETNDPWAPKIGQSGQSSAQPPAYPQQAQTGNQPYPQIGQQYPPQAFAEMPPTMQVNLPPADQAQPQYPVQGQPMSAPPMQGLPMYGQPMSAPPVQGQPMSAPPVLSQPMSAPPMQGQPTSAPPVSAPPTVSFGPNASYPMSGPPATNAPVSVAPISGPAFGGAASTGSDPLLQSPSSPTWQPRITPTPKPQKTKLGLGLSIGLAAGLLVFGGTGFGVGRMTAPDSPKTPASSAATPGAWEQTQLNITKTKISGDLATLAQKWMPSLSGCSKDQDPGGPKLNDGEVTRVTCSSGSVGVNFVQFRSTSDRDKARTTKLAQNTDAKTLTPGATEPAQNKDGYDYIEFATKDNQQRVIGGIWWNSVDKPIAAYVLAYWKDGMGTQWEPLREYWQRYR